MNLGKLSLRIINYRKCFFRFFFLSLLLQLIKRCREEVSCEKLTRGSECNREIKRAKRIEQPNAFSAKIRRAENAVSVVP